MFHIQFSLKVKLSLPLLCVCALPGKAVQKMTYGTLNPTHSLTLQICRIIGAGWAVSDGRWHGFVKEQQQSKIF